MVVSLVLVALLAGLFGLSSTLNPIDAILGRAAIVEVPDLVGRTQPAALAEARAAGFDPEGHLGVQPHRQAGVGRRGRTRSRSHGLVREACSRSR